MFSDLNIGFYVKNHPIVLPTGLAASAYSNMNNIILNWKYKHEQIQK